LRRTRPNGHGEPPTWLRACELPAYYPVLGATTWRLLIRSGELPSRKLGSARIVRASDVEALLSEAGAVEKGAVA
jgi:hypothetical protein